MPSTLPAFLREAVGPHEVIAVRRDTAAAHVVEVRDRAGRTWFGKWLRAQEKWRAEETAHRCWAPHLRGRMPGLRAADPERHLLVVSAVPGQMRGRRTRAAFADAGRVLARLHALGPRVGRPLDDDAAWKDWLDRADAGVDEVFTRARRFGVALDEGLVRDRMERIRELPTQPIVPGHGDFGPHNWVVDDGAVHLLDFANSGWQPPALDLARLQAGACWDRPRAMAALLACYGGLAADQRRLADLHLAINGARQWVRGTMLDDPRRVERGRRILERVAAGESCFPDATV